MDKFPTDDRKWVGVDRLSFVAKSTKELYGAAKPRA